MHRSTYKLGERVNLENDCLELLSEFQEAFVFDKSPDDLQHTLEHTEVELRATSHGIMYVYNF